MIRDADIPVLCSPQHLQHHESGVEGESCYYHCVLCNYSTKAKLNLIQHVRSMKHQRSESLRKLQRLQKGLPEEEEDLGQIFTIRKCPAAEAGECCCSAWGAGGTSPTAWGRCLGTAQGCPCVSSLLRADSSSVIISYISYPALQGGFGVLKCVCWCLTPWDIV